MSAGARDRQCGTRETYCKDRGLSHLLDGYISRCFQLLAVVSFIDSIATFLHSDLFGTEPSGDIVDVGNLKSQLARLQASDLR